MAGIGFEIRRLMDEDTYTGDFKAYFFAGIISSGPWIVSILSLGFLWLLSYPYFTMEVQKLFRVVIVYTYAYSLISTGFLQFVLNRYLSDRLFMKQRNLFLPTYVGVMLTTVLVQGLIATTFYSFCDVDLQFKIIGVLLFIAVSCVWQTMIFLSAARDFMSIIGGFFWGNVVGIVAAVLLAPRAGFNGYIMGYALGQAVLLFFLMYRIFSEFDSPVFCSFDFLNYIRKYFDIFLIGVFYYLAIWADKILYWYSSGGEHNRLLFYSHYPYDSCMFLAFVTIMPAIAFFMVDVETNFYDTYKGFYGSLVNKGPLKDILKKKLGMVKFLGQATSRMLMLQAVITGGFLLYAPVLVKIVRLQPEHVAVIMRAGLGAFFHVFLLLSLILLLYFDRRRAAVFTTFFFMLTNIVFTEYIIKQRPDLMGLGYALAAGFSSVLGMGLLLYNVLNIEYLTFVGQPLMKPKLAKPESI